MKFVEIPEGYPTLEQVEAWMYLYRAIFPLDRLEHTGLTELWEAYHPNVTWTEAHDWYWSIKND